jgi:hypothetical protein
VNPAINPALIALCLAFNATGGRIGDAKQKARPPTSAAGKPMCISFHSKGDFVSHCRCAPDHAPHSLAEDAKLQTWIEKHMAVPLQT